MIVVQALPGGIVTADGAHPPGTLVARSTIARPQSAKELLSIAPAPLRSPTPVTAAFQPAGFKVPSLPLQPGPALPNLSDLTSLVSTGLSAQGLTGLSTAADAFGLVLAARDLHQEWTDAERKLSLPVIADAIGCFASAASILCYILPSARPLGGLATALKPVGAVIGTSERLITIYKSAGQPEPLSGLLLSADMRDLGDSLKDAAALPRKGR